jgi:hypothetical protein
MTEELKKTIKEELAKIPKELRDAIASLDWVNIIREIGDKLLLTESQIENLQVETLLVLARITDLEFYANNIENETNVITETANQIAEEARVKIFNPIENALKENIKNNIKNTNLDWETSVNFILSGGDYTTIISPAATVGAPTSTQSTAPEKKYSNVPIPPAPPIKPPNLAEIKKKLVI